MIKSREQMVQEVDENQMQNWSADDVYEAGYTDALQDYEEDLTEKITEAIYGLANDLGCDLKNIETAKEYVINALKK